MSADNVSTNVLLIQIYMQMMTVVIVNKFVQRVNLRIPLIEYVRLTAYQSSNIISDASHYVPPVIMPTQLEIACSQPNVIQLFPLLKMAQQSV